MTLASRPSAVLVLDFDGTLCIGDDPVLFYAEEIQRRHNAARGLVDQTREFFARVRDVPDAPDGYHAVATLATAAGVPTSVLGEGYLASRRRLDDGEGETNPPDGVAELLTQVRHHGVQVVLVTNAPAVGAQSWIERQGLGSLIDRLWPDAGKPAAMPGILEELAAGLAGPGRLASVGDVWINDVEPAVRRGSAGFFIDRFGRGDGPCTAAAPTFEELAPAIASWAREHLGADDVAS
ncbi:HAD family hydrolase [Ruania rhizosphaerae]|uniref:HAD family hydrolase n=1 Tax=Ruania rhizosphaerae TaxID=1840413 RepID=UPI001359EB0A|nr:HAD family hydrolase [Ruania rhizosphaerae]